MNERKNLKHLIKKLKFPPNQYLKLIALILAASGICLMPAGFIFYSFNEEAHSFEARFSRMLLFVKENCENNFDNLLASANAEPLSELLSEKLPSTEEIFFAEWANDWFPTIDVSIYGNIIEEIGAGMIGDVDLDGRPPIADLNISSYSNSSRLSLIQCSMLWDRSDQYSLVSTMPKLWFNSISGDNFSAFLLKNHFNITNLQFTFISTWIQTSKDTWVPYIAYIDIFEYLNYGFLGIGLVNLLLGIILFIKEKKRIK